MRSAYRTPSPEKAASDGSRKHSPWTAQRARKKGKNSPDSKPGLPDVDESEMEDSALMEEEFSRSQSARELALHLAQNPWLDHAQLPLAFGSAIGVEGLATLTGRTTHRSLVLQSSQVPPLSANTCLLQTSLHTGALQLAQSFQREQPPFGATATGLVPQLGPGAVCTSTLDFGFGASKENAPPHRLLAPGGVSEGTSDHAHRLSIRNAGVSQAAERASQQATSRGWNTEACGSLQHATACCDDAGELAMQVDCQHDQDPPLTPRMDSSRLPSVAPTPSPSVLAPGIRLEGQGKAPPRVPSSCRTIRRVLVASPDGSSGWQTRPGSGLSVDMQGPDMARAALRFGGQDGEAVPMSVEKLLHEPKRRLSIPAVFETVEEGEAPEETLHTGSTLTWFRATPYEADRQGDDDPDAMDHRGCRSDSGGASPSFVLKRGNITPDNLLPEFDEEDRGPTPRGPLKGSSGHSISRSGELTTFDERLHEAVQNGDAMMVGQAWHDVKSGAVKTDDIDTLNTLLKCFCKIDGDPTDADEIVKEVCKDGRLTPNASTYHHLAAIWTRHEQLNNTD